jgi:diguanylate cyclase (GGDEF)-like protein
MGTFKTRRALIGSLRTRMLLMMMAAFLAVSVPAYFSFTWIVNSAVVTLGTLFAEKQILFDRYRGLGALMQEVKLAETLARAPAILEWAQDEDNAERQQRGLAELEHYRAAFGDKSYFFVVGASGNYYFNDAANSYDGEQLRYRLSRDNLRDGWYYKTTALGEGCHLNVDHDDVLAVTKVWINCVIRDDDGVIGVLGSGLDLSAFISEVVDIPQTGVTAMFVDRSGAVQAHRDPRLVDFHSITKEGDSKKTIYSLIDKPQDRAMLGELMREVTSGEVLVRSRFMQVDGREVLVGVGYLDRLGWYNVTFMDVDEIIDRDLFLPIGLLLAAIMAGGALVVSLVFKRRVLDRLARIEGRFTAVREGDFAPIPTDPGKDEIGRLSQAFVAMASTVGSNTQMLEQMVEERTEQLRLLAYRDQLTAIANRRGFVDAYEKVQAEADISGARLGLLLIDIDRFKDINDGFGHHAGDQVIVEIARRLLMVMRPTDVCGRWGGDEFIVLINDVGTKGLRTIAEAVKRAVSVGPVTLQDEREVPVTASIGACLIEPGDDIDTVVDMADTALYRAKSEGRDRVTVFDPQREAAA